MVVERMMLSISEVMEVTGLHRTMIFEELSRGRLRSVRVGRRRLVPRDELERYVEMLKAEAGFNGDDLVGSPSCPSP